MRTTKTRREELEAKEGTKAQQEQQEPNQDLDQGLADPKTKWNAVLEWGKLFGKLSSDKRVMEFA